MEYDRRQRRRMVPEGFIFIQVEQDDGGRVLNISEEGLCFEAFSPVTVSGTVHFWFSFNLRDRIEALGRLVWIDHKKGIGGLTFTDLSQPVGEQIRALTSGFSADTNRSKSALAAGRDGLEPAVVPADDIAGSVVPGLGDSEGLAMLARRHRTVQTTAESVGPTQLVPAQRHASAMHAQFIRGMLLGIMITCAVIIPVLKYAKPQQKSAGKEAPGQMAGEAPRAQDRPETPKGPDTRPIGSVSSPAVKPQESKPASYALSHVAGSPLKGPDPEPSVPTESRTGRSVVGPDKATRPGKIAATPQQLWAAVEAGNAKAAVTLADFYVRGEGVPVNCEQARVLLLVASGKKNQEAIRKLKDLDRIGCPKP